MKLQRQYRYVIVSPVRDEAEYLEKTIRSMVQQTIRPAQWIIVNDGSRDGTGEIAERWANQHPWINALHRADRGRREPGTGVVQAFNEGYSHINEPNWDFIAKLDGDLEFAPDYFENCFHEFEEDPKLGIGGGLICHETGQGLEPERTPRFHVRGATKIYRRKCWEDIGGFIAAPGWDTIDEVKANMMGWSTRTFETLQVLHHRFTGAATGGWQNAIKNGIGSYISGYHPLFMLARCCNQLRERPYVVGSVGLLYGFLLGYFRGIPQVQDQQLIRYVRQQQLRRLFSAASIWR